MRRSDGGSDDDLCDILRLRGVLVSPPDRPLLSRGVSSALIMLREYILSSRSSVNMYEAANLQERWW